MLGLIVLGLIAWGGYGLGWRWTGLSARVTLWDWLEALALPVALGSVPLLVTHRRRLRRTHYSTGAVLLLAFAALVLAGYLVPLTWTGFTGNTLWDWLQLLLLPLVVALASVWEVGSGAGKAAVAAAVFALILFATLVICGYLVPLRWTGFTGNTAWDWLKLLLVPALVPTVLMPFVTDLVQRRLVEDGADPDRTSPEPS